MVAARSSPARRLAALALLLAAGLGLMGLPGTVDAAGNRTQTRSVVSSGFGPSEEEAVAAALARAVSQVQGSSSSLSVSTGRTVSEVHGRLNSSGRVTTLDASASTGSTPDVGMQAAGQVSRYDMVSSRREKDGFRVTVRAYFDTEVYDSPGAAVAGRTRLAVSAPAAVGRPADAPRDGDRLGNELRKALERAFINGGVYSVLDRQTLDASMRELNLVASDMTAPAEKLKLQNWRGADIILLPEVRFDQRDASAAGSRFTGQSARVSSDVTVEIRALVPATSEVVFSQQYRVGDTVSSEAAITDMAVRVAANLTQKMTGVAPGPVYVGAIGLPSQAAPVRPPLPPEETEGVRLPFDK